MTAMPRSVAAQAAPRMPNESKRKSGCFHEVDVWIGSGLMFKKHYVSAGRNGLIAWFLFCFASKPARIARLGLILTLQLLFRVARPHPPGAPRLLVTGA